MTQEDTQTPKKKTLRIGFCGEVSSGKSTALQSVLRQACIPDFFGLEKRPIIRVRLGAETDKVEVRMENGDREEVQNALEIEPTEDIAEIVIDRTQDSGLGECELIEVPALRDGHLSRDQISLIQRCTVLVWTTIGSQAWRLSEKNILDQVGKRLPGRRILLATRADKFRSAADRDKLSERLERETAEYFGAGRLLGVVPKLLTADTTEAQWDEAGVTDFVSVLSETVSEIRLAAEAAAAGEEIDLPDALTAVPQDRSARQASQKRRIEKRFETMEVDTVDDEDDTPPELEEVSESDRIDIIAPSENAERLMEKVEKATSSATDHGQPEDLMGDFVSSLHGLKAIGTVEIDDPEKVERLFGSEEAVSDFAKFAGMSAKAIMDIDGLFEQGLKPESEQIVMKKHNILYRIKDGKVLFLAGETATLSAGIARTAFARLVHLYETKLPEVSKAA